MQLHLDERRPSRVRSDDDSFQISLNSISLRSGLARTSAARPLLTYTPAMIVSRLAETAGEWIEEIRNAILLKIFWKEDGPTPLCFSALGIQIFV